ncbi:uncharacterized protein LOC114539287 [Dendronephthya gigantea]|uniref:uncharacterized protein LOC114539287 n=1 Tax=Dendronephthya gigantea TaxID=151771 RepID=UPI00106A2F9F|nr:uncharacterized protein LOC114539287 [Dendronephthya gigantea]
MSHLANIENCGAFSNGVDILSMPSPCMQSTPTTNPVCKDALSSSQVSTPSPKMKKTPKMEKSKAAGLPTDMGFPERFSMKVERAIEEGNILPVRRQLIADIAQFYQGLSNSPQQGDYKRIALKTCEKFPQLKDSTGTNFWASVQRQLSQYFRNQRRYSKVRLSTDSKNGCPASKLAKISDSKVDDAVTQQRNLELLKDYQVGSISGKTFVTLVEDTYQARRKFITS